MKKIISRVLIFIMLFTAAAGAGITVQADSVKKTTSRAVYVVFDNSGSMYGPGNMAWSQATYAMEVFAAMLNFENGDIMKVFPMHNVTTNGNGGTDSNSSINIKKRSDIAQIHNMYTPQPKGTPYTQVNNAAAELNAVLDAGTTDEGWLVVLTDGDFDSDIPKNGLSGDLIAKASAKENLYVQYLAIGSEVKDIPKASEVDGFYAQKAGNSSEVVNELAVISNRISKRNEYLDYSEETGLDIDVPLSKVIVFAQGKNVKIESLKNKEGGEIKLQECYEVSCSATDGAGLTSFVTKTPVKDTSLKGAVAIFADDSSSIVEGTYSLTVSGAEQVKVYYEPDVKFEVGIFSGEDKVDAETIEGGNYTVKVGFVNQLTGKFIEESKLLGKPEYTLLVNGEPQELSGDKSTLQTKSLDVMGDTLELEADVTYLDNYRDHMSLSYSVCTLDMQVDAKKKVQLKSLENEENGIQVSATKNGGTLTKEQWEQAVVEVKAIDEEENEFPIEWDIRKGEEVSTWVLAPKYKDGDMFATGTGKADVSISVAADIDGITYGSAQTVTMDVVDDKGIVDFIKRYWKEIVVSLLFLILFLGYVPPFKKRFPRKMKKRPSIECTAEKIGVHDMVVKGNFEKNKLSVFLPYTAETGRLTFSPAPVKKTAKVKSTGGSGMVIMNTQVFAGKEEITFNGMSIPENYKDHYRITASSIIALSTPEFTYTCIPNVQRAADGSIKKGKRKK